MKNNTIYDLNKKTLRDIIDKSSICLCSNKNKIFKCNKCDINPRDNISDAINKKIKKWKIEFENNNINNCMMKQSIKNKTPCTTSNINSHSLSKGANFIEEFDWYKFESGNIFRDNSLKLKKYGIGSASTFKGFCKIHDEIFQSADRGVDNENVSIDFVNQLIYRQMNFELHGRKQIEYINSEQKKFILLLKQIIKEEYKRFINVHYLSAQINNDKIVTSDLENQIKNIESLLIDERDSFNKLDLKTNIDKKDQIYFKYCSLDSNFKVNISTLYCPKLKVNGKTFSNNKYNINKNVYIFVLNNNGKPLLIMACEKEDSDLISFIDDFFNIRKKEERLLKYSILFNNVYFSKDFYQKKIHKKQIETLKKLYLKHNELLNSKAYYNKEDIFETGLNHFKKTYKVLNLNKGIKYN